MDLADEHLPRWVDLVPAVDDLPATTRADMLDRLARLELPGVDAGWQLAMWHELREIVDRHQEFPDAVWALDSSTVAQLADVAKLLEPQSPTRRHARLFDWTPHLQGVSRGNFEEYNQALAEARANAIREVLADAGLDGIKDLALASKLPEDVGSQLATIEAGRFSAEILSLLGGSDELARFARGWVYTGASAGDSWLRQVRPELTGLSNEQQAAFLVAIGPPKAEVLDVLAEMNDDVRRLYWTSLPPFPVEPDQVPAVVDQLLAHGRPRTAIDILSLALHRAPGQPPPDQALVPLVVTALDAGLTAAETDLGQQVATLPYEIGQLLDFLVEQAATESDLVRFEWGYFTVLEHTREPRALHAAIGREPSFFVDLVCHVYRAKNSPRPTDLTEAQAAIARNAWHVLSEWRRPPGLNDRGEIDATALRSWVRQARLLLSDRDRAEIGDQQIGQVLSGAPDGPDGIWPPVEIRELIEDLASRDLEVGLATGKYNSRGVTSRGVYDGGAQEWTIADGYKKSAAAVVDRWPRTGRLLYEIAEDYEQMARREDAEAQALAND